MKQQDIIRAGYKNYNKIKIFLKHGGKEHEEKNIRQNYTEKRPAKNNMLIDNVDQKTLEWLEMMRRKKE